VTKFTGAVDGVTGLRAIGELDGVKFTAVQHRNQMFDLAKPHDNSVVPSETGALQRMVPQENKPQTPYQFPLNPLLRGDI
jgi:hypothetical protein